MRVVFCLYDRFDPKRLRTLQHIWKRRLCEVKCYADEQVAKVDHFVRTDE